MWVKRYLSCRAHPWTLFLRNQLKKLGDERFIFHQNLDLRTIQNSEVNKPYKDIFLAWAKYNTKPVELSNILDQQIFYNKDILTQNGKTIFYKSLAQKNIFYINPSAMKLFYPPSLWSRASEARQLKRAPWGVKNFEKILFCKLGPIPSPSSNLKWFGRTV